jgi:3-methylfumaryl-CoA hydratase
VPQDVPITAEELASYQAHVGRRMEEADHVAVEVVQRFAAALDQDWRADAPLPPLWHYGLFLTTTPTARLGPDGHPPRGEFLPAVRLPRRMFAGAELHLNAPLHADRPATRISEIRSVDLRKGRTGELVFVRVAITISQDGALCIQEEQTIVYRGDGPPIAPVVPASMLPPPGATTAMAWHPSRTEIFRFSAVMFNAHRIHYDLPYATTVEGYPDLVVNGPLTAIRLCTLAQRAAGPLTAFRFRGEAPLIVDQPVMLSATTNGNECRLAAVRCDGATAMSAVATTA